MCYYQWRMYSTVYSCLSTKRFFMAALRSRCGDSILPLWFLLLFGRPIGHVITFCSCGFFFLLLSSSFFFPLILSCRRLDVYYISTDGVALARIHNAGLKCAAHGSLKYRTQKLRKKSSSAHHRARLSGYIFTTKACIDNQKKTC